MVTELLRSQINAVLGTEINTVTIRSLIWALFLLFPLLFSSLALSLFSLPSPRRCRDAAAETQLLGRRRSSTATAETPPPGRCRSSTSSPPGPKLEILIRLASGLFQHGRVDECDLWKLTEFNSDSRVINELNRALIESSFELLVKRIGSFAVLIISKGRPTTMGTSKQKRDLHVSTTGP
ncbi:hypothetical protein Taro_023119 [Colocasia esculenta]|uniref:Uncharacterized protein n=1 Tax=Colocasia esculenta TaxID=4460 RepID=A0A843VAG0_COLES|nr:hypothetical protein [Colocasia esculenta]